MTLSWSSVEFGDEEGFSSCSTLWCNGQQLFSLLQQVPQTMAHRQQTFISDSVGGLTSRIKGTRFRM